MQKPLLELELAPMSAQDKRGGGDDWRASFLSIALCFSNIYTSFWSGVILVDVAQGSCADAEQNPKRWMRSINLLSLNARKSATSKVIAHMQRRRSLGIKAAVMVQAQS